MHVLTMRERKGEKVECVFYDKFTHWVSTYGVQNWGDSLEDAALIDDSDSDDSVVEEWLQKKCEISCFFNTGTK